MRRAREAFLGIHKSDARAVVDVGCVCRQPGVRAHPSEECPSEATWMHRLPVAAGRPPPGLGRLRLRPFRIPCVRSVTEWRPRTRSRRGARPDAGRRADDPPGRDAAGKPERLSLAVDPSRLRDRWPRGSKSGVQTLTSCGDHRGPDRPVTASGVVVTRRRPGAARARRSHRKRCRALAVIACGDACHHCSSLGVDARRLGTRCHPPIRETRPGRRRS